MILCGMHFCQNHNTGATSPTELFLAHLQNRPVQLTSWVTMVGHNCQYLLVILESDVTMLASVPFHILIFIQPYHKSYQLQLK